MLMVGGREEEEDGYSWFAKRGAERCGDSRALSVVTAWLGVQRGHIRREGGTHLRVEVPHVLQHALEVVRHLVPHDGIGRPWRRSGLGIADHALADRPECVSAAALRSGQAVTHERVRVCSFEVV